VKRSRHSQTLPVVFSGNGCDIRLATAGFLTTPRWLTKVVVPIKTLGQRVRASRFRVWQKHLWRGSLAEDNSGNNKDSSRSLETAAKGAQQKRRNLKICVGL
jgi:hypothetical protein